MAGSSSIGEPADNPVGINVVPMVDVIFCLCLFFMCSLQFKQLEGKIEVWLPQGSGVNQTPATFIDDIRVSLRWDHRSGRTTRKVGSTETPGDLDFERALHRYPKGHELAVSIDATPDVPWRDAVHALDLCRRNKFEKIEFAQPMR